MKRFLLAVLLLMAGSAAAWSQQGFSLKDGDRVVFYGDSITDQRLYTMFAETYVVTRFPQMKVSFVHSGWGGDRVTGGGGGPIGRRISRDVLPFKPTVVTIMLGMNDGSYRAFDQEIFDTYANGYRHIVRSLKSALPGVRITAIQPSPFDDVTREPNFPSGYNAVLVRYGQFVAELARNEGLGISDFNAPVVAALTKAKAADAKVASQIVPDRVHPGPGGHLLMAESLLKTWNAPSLVTSVTIDAAARTGEGQNTVISGLKAEAGGLEWTQKDGALPMFLDPKDKPLQLAVASSDFIEAMNQQPLKVTGLSAARYALTIDAERAGTFTKEQLAGGVNLATLATPMQEQAKRVHELTREHNAIHFARWREVQVPLEDDYLRNRQPALQALDALETELIARQRAAALPVPHRYQLTPEP
ncbi:MAG TPA: SGNH/GDSL hydrolase family protein [Bryobacteraceae bacterium]|nr:SGNH/GDSL hydrolase family protein [Bryobacteraceae bacterium]